MHIYIYIYIHIRITHTHISFTYRPGRFHEEDPHDKEGPCKLCQTLPPTFLARTEADIL